MTWRLLPPMEAAAFRGICDMVVWFLVLRPRQSLGSVVQSALGKCDSGRISMELSHWHL